jgi:glycosyltransferase involved in cell wall biosynthesis
MKILHVGPLKGARSATGVTQSIRGLAPAQAAIGLKVGLLPSLPLQGQTMEELPGVCLLAGPRQRQVNAWLISQDWITRIREEFGRPDLVNFHSTYIPFQVALARQCRRVGWPYIVTAHGGMTAVAQSIKNIKKSIANILFFRSFIKHAVAVHAVCDLEAAQIRSLFLVKQVFVVPNGVHECLFDIGEHLSAANLGDFANGADLMLGYIGRIDVYIKGLDLLLDALAKLKLQPDAPNCKLFIVGPFHTNWDQNYILSVIRSRGLEKVVRVLGPKFGQEKWSYFLACDVYVQASRSEAGIPQSLLEAMALGRPYLATPATNVAGAVRQCGGWVCAADSDSIADTIQIIYKSRKLFPDIGQRCRDFVRSRFTWPKIAHQLSEEYAKIIKQHND